jgi:LuxR family maltose regulon positive regulatory protein
VAEAVHHAIAAKDPSEACELIAEHWNAYFNLGHLDTVAGWLDALPPAALTADPRLCLARAWLAIDTGRLPEVEAWVERADAGIRAGNGRHAGLAGEPAALRAVLSFKLGDVPRALRQARHAARPDNNEFVRTVAHCILGLGHYWAGDLAPASEALDTAVALARGTDNDLAASYALGYLALVALEVGDLREAERLADDAGGLSSEPSFAEHFVAMIGHLARGTVLEQRGHLHDAERSLVHAVELSHRGAGAIEIAGAALALARGARLHHSVTSNRPIHPSSANSVL